MVIFSFLNWFRDLIKFEGILFFFFGGGRQDDDDGGKGDQWVEVISLEPRAYIYHNFLVSLLKISSFTASNFFRYIVYGCFCYY